MGERSEAVRFTFPAKLSGATTSTYIDRVLVRQGRGLATLDLAAGPQPYSAAGRKHLVGSPRRGWRGRS